MKLNLPFDYDLIGLIKPGNNRCFVTIVRLDRYHPFVTYERFGDDSCAHGHYFATRPEALHDMIKRSYPNVN